ncbi:MAG TPA: cupin domain-containing protein [Solirubrobacteraceae bacterium]
MGLTHFDEAQTFSYELGHLRGRWTMLGQSAGSRTIGVRRIQLPAGAWSTPAHEHGRSEEIFYVLAGRGLSWQAGRTAEIRAGDGILYAPRRGAHTIRAEEELDLLAFGTREYDESLRLPRLDLSLVGTRGVQSVPGVIDGVPLQFAREAEAGPPEVPAMPGEPPRTIINLEDLEPESVSRTRVKRTRRNFGRRLGSERSGLQHVEVAPGAEAAPPHCHSVEEELFIILTGDGVLILDAEETPVRAGHVVTRPAGTGVAHSFRAGREGLSYLAYGARDPADICYYPRSNKIAFRGVHLIARLEKLDYWDGED